MEQSRPPMPEGMWACRLCEAWNNDIRNYCYKCSASRAIPVPERGESR